MKEYAAFWKRAFQFRGVACRAEFWYPVLVNCIIGIVLDVVSQDIIGWDVRMYSLSDIWFFIILVPNISNGVRRLHDTDRSGWWYVLLLVPLAGFLTLAFLFMDTEFVKNGHRAYNREMGWDVKYPEKDGQYWKYCDESTFYDGDELEYERKDDMG